MNIDEYFKRNGLEYRQVRGATKAQKAVMAADDCDFWNAFFSSGLDHFTDCVDFFFNRRLFPILLSEAARFSDVFEPCCMSGMLGCYLAEGSGADYKGMDSSRIAIEKARKTAVLNHQNPEMFELGDVLEYKGEHEAVIGRFVVNRKYHGINDEWVDAVSRISRNIVLVQAMQYTARSFMPETYGEAFKRHGYRFKLLTESPLEQPSTDALAFVMKAVK